MTKPECYIGCDVAKTHIDVFDPKTRKLSRIKNEATAIDRWTENLKDRSVFIVFEATGSYDYYLRHRLADKQILSSRINPIHGRRFAQAIGVKAKTDVLDAKVLSNYGSSLEPPPDAPPSKTLERLAALQRRRDQLKASVVQERNRAEAEREPDLVNDHLDLVLFMEERILQIDAAIRLLLKQDSELSDRAKLLQTIPGVGVTTANVLISMLPELGHRSGKQIASLVGLAPFNRDSGAYKGRRQISGGRKRVRDALYMAAVTAIQWNDKFKEFYERIKVRSGRGKIALCAVARKILVILNTMVKTQKPFVP